MSVGQNRSPVRPLTTISGLTPYPGELFIDPNTGKLTYKKDNGSNVLIPSPGTLTIRHGDSVILNAGKLTDALDVTIPSADWDSIKPTNIPASMINGLSGNVVAVSDASGKLVSSGISTTILNYLSGLTGNIQTTIQDLYDQISSHTHSNYLPTSGGTISGNLSVTGKLTAGTLTGVSKVFSGTLSTSWSGSAAPYTQAVTVSGILSTDRPILDYTNSGTYSTDSNREEGWLNIYRAVTAANKITFYAHSKPTVSIPFTAFVVR